MARKDESDMAKAVKRYLLRARSGTEVKSHLATTELELKSGRFDVVGYNKLQRTFVLIECKLGENSTSIGHAFGQILTYKYLLSKHGYEFLEKFDEKLKKEGSYLNISDIYPALKKGEVSFRFYVALTHQACKNYRLIRSVRDSIKTKVGIIRVRDNDSCALHLHTEGSKEDGEICMSEEVIVPIIRSYDTREKFFKELENRLQNLLQRNHLENFKTNENKRNYKQFWFKSSNVHFEVGFGRKEIEIALHFESTKKMNYKLLKYFETHKTKIIRALGDEVRFEKWGRGKCKWARVYMSTPWMGIDKDLNEELLDEISENIRLFIVTLQPILEEFEKGDSY